MKASNLDVKDFMETGFKLKDHLESFLNINKEELDLKLSKGLDDLAALHPGSFKADEASDFYEESVGSAHIIDLASWHLNSADYIADTLRLQNSFAHGNLLDFGGGIGTHSLAAASLPEVDHVFFVDLNPENRSFVQARSKDLGVDKYLSVHRDLESTGEIKFDTLICLDVLEHLPDPANQLKIFLDRLNPGAIAIMNWYFYKGDKGEYPFHFDDPDMIEAFFITLQKYFIEKFHPYLITTRAYMPKK